MTRLSTSLLSSALLLAAASAQAAIVADFELNGSLANSAGTAVTLTNNAAAGSLGATGITFGINLGPTISNVTVTPNYTIDAEFTLDSLNGPRGNGYIKLIDFSNLQSDSGYYSYGGHFSAFPFGPSQTTDFVAGQPVRLTFSRDAAGTIAAYIDGNLIYSVSDPDNSSATELKSVLNFFIDDVATAGGLGSSGGEASSGFVDYIRIYDTAITPSQAGAVPEPGNVALLLAGLGLVGVARRRARG